MRYLDSHTGGEPTRLIVEGGPDLGHGTMAERRLRFAEEFDAVRTTLISEPRGTDCLVGGVLCEPVDPGCAAGVVFFNNVGVLQMCGHGTIGLAVTLRHLGRIDEGLHRLETPVGEVVFDLLGSNEVRIENVPSHRHASNVAVEVEGLGRVSGDVAWGGNWFFLSADAPCEIALENEPRLHAAATAVKAALVREGITGADGGEIDHVEFFGPAWAPSANARSYVLCPGGAYDRSPCGTGTSAKLACLAAEGRLAPGEHWVQESILGTTFEASYRLGTEPNTILPSITGTAYVTADTTLVQEPGDPFSDGIGR